MANNINNLFSKKDDILKIMKMSENKKIDYKKSFSMDEEGNFTPKMNHISENSNNLPINTEYATQNHPHFPKEILESFSKTPPTGPIGESVSVLDGLDPEKFNSPAKQTEYQPSTVASTQSGIDYSLIKSIVDESIRKYSNALYKKLISEHKDKVNIISLGDKFNFVTEDGNVYEAELSFKKNIKKKK